MFRWSVKKAHHVQDGKLGFAREPEFIGFHNSPGVAAFPLLLLQIGNSVSFSDVAVVRHGQVTAKQVEGQGVAIKFLGGFSDLPIHAFCAQVFQQHRAGCRG